jgi:phosphoribosylformylglycinamidine (FGAM) synthase PurS component
MLSIHPINKEVVTPIDIPKLDKTRIKGYELFEELYANIFLLAKKKSGKTSTIYKILQKCSNKQTNIIIFSSTVHKDANWLAIVKYFEEHDIHIETYTSIFDDDGENLIQHLLNDLGLEDKKEVKKSKRKSILFDDNNSEEVHYKPKKIAPELIIVFDDMSSELQNKYIGVLLKQNRHYKAKVIISSQYYNDITKQTRQNLDYLLMFGKIPIEKLEDVIYPELDLTIPFPIFFKLYLNATKEKYNFLYNDLREEILRKNFNKQYIIKNIS